MSDLISFQIEAVELAEQPVRLRLPFRFGLITLTEAPQAFVTVRIRSTDGRRATGVAASMLVPKWFDKAPDRDNETNIAHLRKAISLAAQAYQADNQSLPAFGHFAAHYDAVVAAAGLAGINPLTASFGPAMLDAAILDALGQLTGASFYQLMRTNVVGFAPAQMLPEFQSFDVVQWLGGLQPSTSIAARHTVGLVDPIDPIATDERTTNDGLPETLPEVIERYGHRHFKIKVSGDLDADLDRLTRIAAVLDSDSNPYQATLDGNEQFDSVEPVEALWRRMTETPALARLVSSILFIEQPIKRTATMSSPVHALAGQKALIIDESDESLAAFPQARALGYSGVSSKLCKGLYKSLINAARCTVANQAGEHTFMSAEDLTNQAGVAVQQDLALVSLIGLSHVERNGHHYANGFADAGSPVEQGFLADHPDLYTHTNDAVRLSIDAGYLSIGSLECAGFALGSTARRAIIESSSLKFQGV